MNSGRFLHQRGCIKISKNKIIYRASLWWPSSAAIGFVLESSRLKVWRAWLEAEDPGEVCSDLPRNLSRHRMRLSGCEGQRVRAAPLGCGLAMGKY